MQEFYVKIYVSLLSLPSRYSQWRSHAVKLAVHSCPQAGSAPAPAPPQIFACWCRQVSGTDLGVKLPSSVQLGLLRQGSMLYPLAIKRVDSAAQSSQQRTQASAAV